MHVNGPAAIVPAAGRAERFGGGKLLAPLRGQPLLNHTLRSLLDGGVACVIAVVAPGASWPGVDLLADPRVHTVVNADPSRGMFSSIAVGLAAADGHPILVLPADMPFVASATVAAVLAEAIRRDDVIVPTCAGRRGHPIAIPARVRATLLEADIRGTLRAAIAATGIAIVPIEVTDAGVLRDVDVQADLQPGDPSARRFRPPTPS